MTCTNCGPSIMGRNITGRSIPGRDIRYKNEQPITMSTASASLPHKTEFDWGSLFVGIIIGVVVGGFIWTGTGREIMYKSGKKISRKLS